MGIAAILFDLDGTLVDVEHDTIEAMARMLRRDLGIELAQAERDFVVGRSWQAIYRHFRDVHPAITWTQAEMIERTAKEREGVLVESGVSALPGANECLQRFSSWPCALVTGSSRIEVAQIMDGTGWRTHFRAVFASEDVARSKPEPDGYLAAAAALGVDVKDCVVIEDSTPGIASGLAAGAHVVAVRAGNTAGHDQSGAHHSLETLEELTESFLASLGS